MNTQNYIFGTLLRNLTRDVIGAANKRGWQTDLRLAHAIANGELATPHLVIKTIGRDIQREKIDPWTYSFIENLIPEVKKRGNSDQAYYHALAEMMDFKSLVPKQNLLQYQAQLKSSMDFSSFMTVNDSPVATQDNVKLVVPDESFLSERFLILASYFLSMFYESISQY